MQRRRFVLAAACGAASVAGCASSPATRWYELRLDAPDSDGTPPAALAPAPGDMAVWELSPAVGLPAALDRDTLMLASGSAALEPLTGHRWAAPLRESVPRVLLHDLQRLRGAGRVWLAPVPAGVAPTQRLRVELLALQASADRRSLRLQAQWWWQDLAAASATSGGTSPPRVNSAALDVAVADGSVDAIAAAHRVALWRLAQRIAQAPG
jgi:uncharacterized lipoprotein YmbA